MSRIEPPKTFMMISNEKKHLWSPRFIRKEDNVSALKVKVLITYIYIYSLFQQIIFLSTTKNERKISINLLH